MFGTRELTVVGEDLAATNMREMGDGDLVELTVGLERFASLVASARLHAMAELDARAVTDTQYGLTTPPFLAREAERSDSHVRRDLRTANQLRHRLTEVDAALTAGEISIDHVRVIVEACNRRNIDGMALMQREMIDAARGAVFKHWRDDIARLADLLDEDGPHDPNDELARNRLFMSEDLEGCGHLKVKLTPELYAMAKQILNDRSHDLFRRYREVHKLDPDVAIPPHSTLLALALMEAMRESLGVDLDATRGPRVELSLILRSFFPDVEADDPTTGDEGDTDDAGEHAAGRETAGEDQSAPIDDHAPGPEDVAGWPDERAQAERDDAPVGDDTGQGDDTGSGDDWWRGAWDDWEHPDRRGDESEGRAGDGGPDGDDERDIVPSSRLAPCRCGLGRHDRASPGDLSLVEPVCARHRDRKRRRRQVYDEPDPLVRQAMRSVGRHPGAAVFDREGITVPDALLHELLCDPDMYAIVVNSLGVPVDMGRKIEFANRAQRRAMAARDGGCVFPGCDRPIDWTHAHHTDERRHGGHTDVRLLASLCAFHHGVVHRHGWDMHLADDGWFWIQTPGGRTFWAQRRFQQRFDRPPAAILTATA